MAGDGDAAAAAQKQLLALVQTKGNAEKALALLIRSGVADELSTPNSDHEKATTLMRRGVLTERATRTHASPKPSPKARDAKKAKEADKQWAIVAAKVAQSVLKLYVSGTTDAPKDDPRDLVAALDVATLALSVTCQFESLVKLGDFVVDNMLYQVAKKLGEAPQLATRALWIFAALHLRLWHQHSVTCTTLNQKGLSKDASPFAERVDEMLSKRKTTPLALDDMVALCIFPEPQGFHTLQFTRLLISLVNAAVNMLLAAGKNQAILEIAKMLEPWITHLSRIPGADAKLPASFSDRMFRVLWKCAAAADTQKPATGSDDSDESLEYRALALSYMLKCPNYSNGYFVQQVHRVGMQYEKKTKPSRDNDAGIPLHKFYTYSANALFEQRIQPGKGFKESVIEWDYVNWLEHFASICDMQPDAMQSRSRIDALTVLHHAVKHLSTPDLASRIIAGCLLAAGGCAIVDQLHSKNSASVTISEKEVRHVLSSDLFHSTVMPTDQDLIVQASVVGGRKPHDHHLVEALRRYLGGIQLSSSAAQETTSALSDTHLGLVLRLMRRVSTRLFSSLSDNTDLVTENILPSLEASGDLLSLLRRNDAIKLSGALEDSFLSLEGRIRRFSVSIRAKLGTSTTDEQAPAHLAAISKQVVLFQNVFDHAMVDTGKQRVSMQSLLNDLQAIAREAYMCATFYYKKQQHELVEESLTAAFELAENYLDQVMCSDHTANIPRQFEEAHASLKVDALASLLAFSCRQQGKLRLACKYQGHVILYSSDPKVLASGGVIDKYTSSVIEECEDVSGRETEVLERVTTLCESISSAWGARGVGQEAILTTVRAFGDSFERFATRLLDRLRAVTDLSNEATLRDGALQERIELCSKAQIAMWKFLWARAGEVTRSVTQATERVLQAISKRKLAFCEYFLNRDDAQATRGLWVAHDELTQAIKLLSTSKEPAQVDIGGCYGWRGVFTLEICQMRGYAGRLTEDNEGNASTEDKALNDIRQCLVSWRTANVVTLKRAQTSVFDSRGVVICLDAICHALSLMSHFQLESEARELLSAMQASSCNGSTSIDYGVGLPSMILQPAHFASDTTVALSTGAGPQRRPSGEVSSARSLCLSLIDADIGLCLASVNASDLVQARLHLSNAMSGLNDLRSSVKISPEDTHHYTAVAMRELALSMAESEVVFHEGNLVQAIRDAKAALSICWKISKKVGIVEPDRERYDLPIEVKDALGKRADQTQKASQLVCFQAIECWSWDILLAAKLILSRIAHLYVLSNEPFRSSVYYAEAMTLVSGIIPSVTRNRPFFEFAQLQVLAGRTNHATAVHQLVASNSEAESDEASDDETVNTSIIIQNCEFQLQRGDLYLLEGNEDKARECYDQSLRLLGRLEQHTPALCSLLCGCYRRMLKLELHVASTPLPEETVDRMLNTLKNLRKGLKKCSDLVEYALGTSQLVQTSLVLLRSSSSKAFLPPHKLSVLMHDVLARCDHLGIAYVTQEIRFTMGLVCLMQSETAGTSRDEKLGASVNWVAAGYLSNYHLIGATNEGSANADGTKDPNGASRSCESVVSGLDTRLVKLLPDSWLFVSITVGAMSDFTVSLTPTNGREPVSFWVGKIKWADFAQEFSDIIETSRKTLFGNESNGAEDWTADKKKQWWSARKELDDRLRVLISRIQDAFGFWRALFTFLPDARPSPSLATVLKEFSDHIHQSSHELTERSSWLVSATHAMSELLTDRELLQCIDQVAMEENVAIRDEQVQKLVKVFRANKDAVQSQASSIILVLHHQLESFPWEGLDVLYERSVTRVPSIELTLQNAKQSRARGESRQDVTSCVDAGSVSFLLNPAGDLKSTQNNLEPLFRRCETDLNWRGVVGEVPDEDWMRETLVNSSLFVFCGHGSGEKYFHRDKIATLRGQGCAAALLFGCSSGRLEREGVFGPNGAVVSYLEAGSPAVLAMLWDVTDKDVDLMSKDILENWLLASRDRQPPTDGVTLPVALQRSRRLCKLQYLNGLAAVCYGLPLRVGAPKQDTMDSRGSKRRKL